VIEPRSPFRESLHGSRRRGRHYGISPSVRPSRQMALLSASITDGLFSRRKGREMRDATRTSDLDGFAQSEPTLRVAALPRGREGSGASRKREKVRGDGVDR